MNYKVSTCFDRVKGKSAFTIELGGIVKEASVYPSSHANMKKGILQVIAKALAHTKGYVKHDDIVNIEVQNNHLCRWLTGREDFKEYSKELDNVFSILENIDCRYRFLFMAKPYAKEVLQKESCISLKGSSLSQIISELEEKNNA